MAENRKDTNGDQQKESPSDRTPINQPPDPVTSSKSTSAKVKHIDITKLLKLPRVNLRLPQITLKVPINLPVKFFLDRSASSTKPPNWLLLWLSLILISYTCVGYFLAVLSTIPSRQGLAIAGFIIMAILPVVTAYADYGLMKWGYLISGVLIISAFIFLLKIKIYLLLLSIITWIGISMIAFVGEHLLSQEKRLIVTIAMLTTPCLVGLALGWQIWRWAATSMS